ncbi:MAG TPA: hypothetical protein DHW02_10010 [Ktedonobacter sp.]|nr:hypothetical protein [Ktedonobacter sp.]
MKVADWCSLYSCLLLPFPLEFRLVKVSVLRSVFPDALKMTLWEMERDMVKMSLMMDRLLALKCEKV